MQKNPRNLKEANALLKEIKKAGSAAAYARKIKRPANTVRYWAKNARRIKTGDTRPRVPKQRRDKKLKKLIEIMGGRCELCKLSFPPQAYDFHHKNPSEKDFSIAHLLDYSFETILREAQKCALLCSNCHRIAHYVHKNLFTNGESNNG